MSSRLATVDEVESGFLCDLVDGLTATRSEHAVRVTIDAWKERVQAAGLDPDEALVAFRESPPVADLSRDDPQRWANPNKRGFVLACIALYSHGRPS